MRKLKFVLFALSVVVELAAAAIWLFRRNPRMGSDFVNRVINPALVERGLAGRGRAEIATLEHFGRRSGRRYLTPIHPEPTPDGFQILVPLGEHSEWVRNVIAAGNCRMQLHDNVYELDEPTVVRPTELTGLPRFLRRFEDYLGFEYIVLRRFSSTPGSLDELPAAAPVDERTTVVEREPEPVGAAN